METLEMEEAELERTRPAEVSWWCQHWGQSEGQIPYDIKPMGRE